MKQKTTIAIKGKSGQGKSETIKLLRLAIKSFYPLHSENLIFDNGDIKCVITINDIKIGIESQGDPNSRQLKSIEDFLSWDCDIIICACRTSGETEVNVLNLINKGYRLIWAYNYRSRQIPNNQLNQFSVSQILELLNQIILGII